MCKTNLFWVPFRHWFPDCFQTELSCDKRRVFTVSVFTRSSIEGRSVGVRCNVMGILQQTKYLILKNFHIKKRNKRETLQEILVPIWWILLLLIIRSSIPNKVEPAVKESEIPTANISNTGPQGNASKKPNIGYVTNNIPNAGPVMELVINASKDAVNYLEFNSTDSMVAFYKKYSESRGLLVGIEFAKGGKKGLAYTLRVSEGLPSPDNKLVGE